MEAPTARTVHRSTSILCNTLVVYKLNLLNKEYKVLLVVQIFYQSSDSVVAFLTAIRVDYTLFSLRNFALLVRSCPLHW